MKPSNATRTLLATCLVLSATVASAQWDRAGAFTGEDSGSVYLMSHFHSTAARSEVQSGFSQAVADGTQGVLIHADSGSVYLSRHQVLRTPRGEVKFELATAEKNGTLDQMYGEDSGSFALSSIRSHGASQPAFSSK